MMQYSDLGQEELANLIADVPIASFKKGTILLHQGEVPEQCYFVLEGCVRQYAFDEFGKEKTYNFFTEGKSVAILNGHHTDKASKYELGCVEDSVLVVGDLAMEQYFYKMNPALEQMTRKMIEAQLSEMHDEFTTFVTSTPEERYQALTKKRPDLLHRVPQHQLASYLGITPESLSRIKKRFGTNHGKSSD